MKVGMYTRHYSRLQFKEEEVVKNSREIVRECEEGGWWKFVNHTHFLKIDIILRPKSLGEYPCNSCHKRGGGGAAQGVPLSV